MVITLVVLLSVTFFGSRKQSPAAPPAATAGRRILGLDSWQGADYATLKAAGIGWVRTGFGFPYQDKIGGKLRPDFLRSVENAKNIRAQGIRIMGMTSTAGGYRHVDAQHPFVWHLDLPEWAGTADNDSFYVAYEKGCEELARQTKGIVDMWQVSNEMDGDGAGPLSIAQIERFLLAGARGLKAGNPQLKIDINPAFLDRSEDFRPTAPGLSGERLLRDLYSIPDTPFDYAGIDGYLGSFQPGAPQDWALIIERIHNLTGKPVLINEWAYSSKAGNGIPLDPKIGDPVCDIQKWPNSWGKGHTPEVQADFIQIAMKIFATYPNVAGCFYLAWKDRSMVCPICKHADCPRETGWGLLDNQGNPKPALSVFQSLAHEFF